MLISSASPFCFERSNRLVRVGKRPAWLGEPVTLPSSGNLGAIPEQPAQFSINSFWKPTFCPKLFTNMETNPFAVLSLMVAPAILTNATSVLIMSTSNRLARGVDRAREISKQLEETRDFSGPEPQRRLRELAAAEHRALLLLRSLRSFYVALGAFASAAFVSLLGAVLVPVRMESIVIVLEVFGVAAGMVAVSAMVYGSILLLQETRIAVRVISERAATVRERVGQGCPLPSDADKNL